MGRSMFFTVLLCLVLSLSEVNVIFVDLGEIQNRIQRVLAMQNLLGASGGNIPLETHLCCYHTCNNWEQYYHHYCTNNRRKLNCDNCGNFYHICNIINSYHTCNNWEQFYHHYSTNNRWDFLPITWNSPTMSVFFLSSGHTSTTTWETSTTSATPTLEELCKPSSCGSRLSTCVSLNTTYICQCPYGFYYYSKNCYAGKVFPGIITLAQTLSSDIGDVNSMEYEKMFQNITQFFKEAFANMTDYMQTIIVKVNYTADDTSTRSVNNPVTVTVMNIFTANTTETDAKVEKAIETAAGNLNYVSGYTNAPQCAVYPCDDTTTTCEDDGYPACVCKADFTKTQWDTFSCSDCANCTAEENKFCDRQSDTPDCKCLDNFKKEGEKCVRCPVGYSGKNCENNKELILIIVGTVFGAIILCLVAAVSIVSVRAKHSHDPEKKRLIKPRNSNSNTSEETRIFPRVQTTSGHANPGYQPNNPYEVHSSNRGDFVEKDYDDLYEISRQPEGFRLQRR
ncbi:mucin-13 [Phasianus colchicus]|uniref:mucin-13 n=1 Tax=Phasianus colchicus TaxID=9054 RepID=UPI00129EB1FB|nr:mucin-13 [Phasianus colchicus]